MAVHRRRFTFPLQLACLLLLLAGIAAPRFLSGPFSASAATSCSKYASPSGSDSNAGTATSPYRTVQYLVNHLLAHESGCLLAGSYVGNVAFTNGTVTLAGVTGQDAKILGYVWVKSSANDVTIQNLSIDGHDVSPPPVQVNGDRVALRNLNITDRNKPGGAYNGMCVLAGPNFEADRGQHRLRPHDLRQPHPQLRRRRPRARDLPRVDPQGTRRRQLPVRQPRLRDPHVPRRAGLADRVRRDRRQQLQVQGEPDLLRRAGGRRVLARVRLLQQRRPLQPDHQLPLPLQRRVLLPHRVARANRQRRRKLLRLERTLGQLWLFADGRWRCRVRPAKQPRGESALRRSYGQDFRPRV